VNSEANYQYLFGPVPSRRLGLSLGVDLNPVKVCSEDCVFCQVARTTELTTERKEWVPTAAVLAEFDRWAAAGNPADYVDAVRFGRANTSLGLRRSTAACEGRRGLQDRRSEQWLADVDARRSGTNCPLPISLR